jgi:4-amino-4-deoxy-L-arabinose transferase-like glycosyltransferase
LCLRTAARIVARMGQGPETVGPPTSEGLPPGYREGFLTAITVILGFSLALVRFWGLESSGPWTTAEVVSAAVVVIGTGFQLLALFRSLRVEDDNRREYARTVRYFLVGVLIVMLGVFASIVASARVPDQQPGPNRTAPSG